jgi:D-alanyl-lipoteichoic acid acyltransferase DltB (MBOAT superfamily)
MGFELMVNFNLPYFATNPSEFWSRWHISLSTWLRDYLYIPLGGNKHGTFNTYKNLFITMFLGGLWHGAAWTFVLWGGYHGLLLIIYRIWDHVHIAGKKNNHRIIVHFLTKSVKIIFFFHLICLGWLIFRAQSLGQLKVMLFSFIFGWEKDFWNHCIINLGIIMPYLYILFAIEIIQYRKNDLMVVYNFKPKIKFLFYFICSLLLIIFGVTDAQNFIYFQF